jgi:hypothetical protein
LTSTISSNCALPAPAPPVALLTLIVFEPPSVTLCSATTPRNAGSVWSPTISMRVFFVSNFA